MCFLYDVSVSLREEERFEGFLQKKAVVVESPFVQKERKKDKRKKERKEKGRRKKKGSRAVGIRFGFFGQKQIKSFSLFLLS